MRLWAGGTGSLPRSRYLTESELGRLLAAVDCVTRPRTRAKYRLLFLLLANFGPRISELLGGGRPPVVEPIKVRAVDLWEELVDGRPVLTGMITLRTLKRWRKDPATGRRERVEVERTLPLRPELAQALDLYIQVEGLAPADPLFPHFWRKYAWTVFKRALKAAGLPQHYRLHDLRHSAGTYLADKTRDPALVRDVLGHASIATSNIYIHTVQLREKILAAPPILPAVPGCALASPRRRVYNALTGELEPPAPAVIVDPLRSGTWPALARSAAQRTPSSRR